MAKMNLTNNQTAFEYALYMIASSYFDKTVCQSIIQERKMFVQYKQQKFEKQYHMEDICIRYMDELQKKLPEWFFEKQMIVRLVVKNGFTVVTFQNRKGVLELWGAYKGNKTNIHARVWMKEKSSATQLRPAC